MRWVRRCDVWSVECSVGVGRCHGSLAVGHHKQSVHYIRGPADARRVGHLVRSQVDLLFIQGFKLQFRCIQPFSEIANGIGSRIALGYSNSCIVRIIFSMKYTTQQTAVSAEARTLKPAMAAEGGQRRCQMTIDIDNRDTGID